MEEKAAQPVVKEKEQQLPIKNISYPHAPSRRDAERQFRRFVEVIKKLQIHIPFTEALEQMSIYERVAYQEAEVPKVGDHRIRSRL